MFTTPMPRQIERNFDKLVERIANYGATTVYLQAYADDDGNGVAEAVYFPNRHIKMKAICQPHRLAADHPRRCESVCLDADDGV